MRSGTEVSKSQQKRMACWNCPRYCRDEFRCLDGKANPRKKTDTIMVAEVLGVRALCHYNLYREALVQRMYFPRHPDTVQASARVISKKRRRFMDIEPDIAADSQSQDMPIDS